MCTQQPHCFIMHHTPIFKDVFFKCRTPTDSHQNSYSDLTEELSSFIFVCLFAWFLTLSLWTRFFESLPLLLADLAWILAVLLRELLGCRTTKVLLGLPRIPQQNICPFLFSDRLLLRR